MKIVLDMIHHNPGEEPFKTSFADPGKLSSYGYNSQAFKHINCAATFDKLGMDLWPASSQQRKWLDEFTQNCCKQINTAKSAGLDIFYQIDLFILPAKLVENLKSKICNHDGSISLDKEMTLELHRMMFEEIFNRFPDIDGLIVRIGDTYLYDMPYHVGNGAVDYDSFGQTQKEKQQLVKLINFLKEEICEKHDKKLIFRTWDCYQDRFHASADYYCEVTDQIQPHDNLYFSIKHTQLDFWRYVEFNPCLGKGRHHQIVEVQCQREYEGKGAYPSYVMDKVIEGFPETDSKKGLRNIVNHYLIKGLCTWSRGGGWYGPYLTSELWPDMNAFVLSKWFTHPLLTERQCFDIYCKDHLGMRSSSVAKFRELVDVCEQAVLKGRYCQVFDQDRDSTHFPTHNWLRDDRIGGYNMLKPVFDVICDKKLLKKSVQEKIESIELWQQACDMIDEIEITDKYKAEFIKTSILYGKLLFEFTSLYWKLMVNQYWYDKTDKWLFPEVCLDLGDCKWSWNQYLQLSENPLASTLFKGTQLNMFSESLGSGLIGSLEELEAKLI